MWKYNGHEWLPFNMWKLSWWKYSDGYGALLFIYLGPLGLKWYKN